MSAVNTLTTTKSQSSCDCTVLGICLYTSDLGLGKCPTPGQGLTSGGGAISAPGSGNPVGDYWNNLTHGGNPVSAAQTAGYDIHNSVASLLGNLGIPNASSVQESLVRGGMVTVGIILVVIGLTKLFTGK